MPFACCSVFPVLPAAVLSRAVVPQIQNLAIGVTISKSQAK